MDNVPLYWMPLYYLYAGGLGGLLIFYLRVVQLTSRVYRSGKLPSRNVILCLWHDNLILYFTTSAWHRNHVWMNHPLWYMGPIWVMLWLSGIRNQIAGSSGNDGRQAAEKLASSLKQGASTLLAPDGPEGPPKKMKPGVLHLAAETDVPVVALKFDYSGRLRLRGWDRKKVPLPFGRIDVCYSEPVFVQANHLEPAKEKLNPRLGL